jgi:transcriptional regulator with XRE-family HTH domain
VSPRSITPATVFGRRLKEARLRVGLPQDKLGVKIGLDEATASARISRYENGVHKPPASTSNRIAQVLGVPHPYLYCEDDDLATVILAWGRLSETGKQSVKDFVVKVLASP